MHLGNDYLSHEHVGMSKVNDGFGNVKEGEFAHLYLYKWDSIGGKGKTKVAFFFSAKGQFTGLRVLETDAVFVPPFQAAGATIEVLGAAIIQAAGDNLTQNERQVIKQIVTNADAKQLLEVGLMLDLRGK